MGLGAFDNDGQRVGLGAFDTERRRVGEGFLDVERRVREGLRDIDLRVGEGLLMLSTLDVAGTKIPLISTPRMSHCRRGVDLDSETAIVMTANPP